MSQRTHPLRWVALVLTGVLLSVLTFTVPAPTPALAADQAYLRVVHASPDTGAVDVYVNGATVLTNVPYQAVSEYLPLMPGTYSVAVTATGAPLADAVLGPADVTVAAGDVLTAAAVGLSQATPATLALNTFTDNISAPAFGSTKVTVYHLSPDAPNVDVKATIDGSDVTLIGDLPFGESNTNRSTPLVVAAGTYDLKVTPAGSDTVVADLAGTTLDAGQVYSVFAFGLVDAGAPSGQEFTVALQAEYAQLRGVHASPDAPAVDIYADGNLLLQNVVYKDVSPYYTLLRGTYTVQVVPTGTDPNTPANVVLAGDATLVGNTTYTVGVVGLLADSSLAFAITEDDISTSQQASVNVYHFSPDTGGVDVINADSPTPALISNLTFTNSQNIKVPAGTYNLGVTLSGSTDVVLPLNNLTLDAGQVYSVFAFGESTATPPTLELGSTVEYGFVRAVHASPTTPNVDAYITKTGDAHPYGDTQIVQDVSFRTVSGYLSVLRGTYVINVTLTGDPVANADITTPPSMVMGGTSYTFAATGSTDAAIAAVGFALLVDDRTAPTSGNGGVTFYNLVEGTVGLDLSNGTTDLVTGVMYQASDSNKSVPPGDYTLSVADGGLEVTAPISIAAGTNYDVFVIGGSDAYGADLFLIVTPNGQAFSLNLLYLPVVFTTDDF